MAENEEDFAATWEERYKFHLQEANFWKERTKSSDFSSTLQAQAAAGAFTHNKNNKRYTTEANKYLLVN